MGQKGGLHTPPPSPSPPNTRGVAHKTGMRLGIRRAHRRTGFPPLPPPSPWVPTQARPADDVESIDAAAYPFILVLFAGPRHEDDIARRARRAGIRVLCVDVLRGGGQHDVRNAVVKGKLLRHCASKEAGGTALARAAHVASPCRSFSPLLHELGLRSRDDPMGTRAPRAFSEYIERENSIIEFSVEIARALLRRGCPVLWENPPPLWERHKPWWWAERQHMASLWDMPWLVELQREFDLVRETAPMCMFGAKYRKYFSILGPRSVEGRLASMGALRCSGEGSHSNHPPACGVDESGQSRAKLAGRYPASLNDFILETLASVASLQGGEQTEMEGEGEQGGGVLDEQNDAGRDRGKGQDDAGGGSAATVGGGFAATEEVILGERVRQKVEGARRMPAGFSSLRYLQHASPEELMATALPDVRALAEELARASSDGEGEGDTTRTAKQWDGVSDWRNLTVGAPEGRIRLVDLIGADALRAWEDYLGRTQLAFDAIKAGRPHHPPGDFVIEEAEVVGWARCFVWDTRDPENCLPVRRSTQQTIFPGEKQFDRQRLREVAAQLGWMSVDPDIVEQAGGGGFELRSDAPRHTTAVWHHSGLVSHFETADQVVRFEREQQWTDVSTSPLPFVPTVFSPRDVVWQERGRLEGGKLVMFMKPRVTHDMSAVPRQLGGRKVAESINSAIPRRSKALPGLPRVQAYARAQAVCSLAGGAVPSEAAGVYGVDETKAYSFGVVQEAEHFAGCYLWPDEGGQVRPHISKRMVFGGGSWPNRFERLSLMVCAWIQRCQREFDSTQEYSTKAREWVAERQRLQAEGVLPQGEAQLWPAGLEPYIDDFTGRALQDTVDVPDELRDIQTGEENTRAIGAQPAARDSRVSVHCRIAAYQLRWLGAEVPDDKTMCGSGMVALGVQLDAASQVVRCPELKRMWLLHAVETIRSQLRKEQQVTVKLMAKFTGRLTNLSQFFPELRRPLAVGYALSRVSWRTARNGARWPLAVLHVRERGRRFNELLELLSVTEAVAGADVGVAMAPPSVFPALTDAGVLTVVTDASRADVDDGFGGYAVWAGSEPRTIFVMSQPWPEDIKEALDAATVKRSLRKSEEGRGAEDAVRRLSMPAAETFAAVAMAAATRAERGGRVEAVIAIGDCAPAAVALSALYSAAPQLRHLTGIAASITSRWLGVAVPRELNEVADLLSHPSRAREVIEGFRQRGFEVVRVQTPLELWDLASAAAQLPLGGGDVRGDDMDTTHPTHAETNPLPLSTL